MHIDDAAGVRPEAGVDDAILNRHKRRIEIASKVAGNQICPSNRKAEDIEMIITEKVLHLGRSRT